jgi:hypothetical protein
MIRNEFIELNLSIVTTNYYHFSAIYRAAFLVTPSLR